MTVIAWDGKTLAADRRGTCGGGTVFSTRKIERVGDMLVGFSGQANRIGEVRAWLEAGAAHDGYPTAPNGDSAVYMLVVHRDGRVVRYENGPYPIPILDEQTALGSGHESARVAMHLGCTAAAAIAVVSLFDSGCGNGVDTLTFDDPPVDA